MLFQKYCSQPRWLSYRQAPDEPDDMIMARYLWNVQLCEALYPSLNFIEIVLRNQVEAAISRHFGEGWLSEESSLLAAPEQSEIAKAKSKLKMPTRGHLVAELSFGFWTGLFKKHYRTRLWHQCIKDAFPYLNRKNRNPAYTYEKLNQVRRLRNRVFHHEPIWKHPHLGQQHQLIIEALSWVSPDLPNVLSRVDRFPDVLLNPAGVD